MLTAQRHLDRGFHSRDSGFAIEYPSKKFGITRFMPKFPACVTTWVPIAPHPEDPKFWRMALDAQDGNTVKLVIPFCRRTFSTNPRRMFKRWAVRSTAACTTGPFRRLTPRGYSKKLFAKKLRVSKGISYFF